MKPLRDKLTPVDCFGPFECVCSPKKPPAMEFPRFALEIQRRIGGDITRYLVLSLNNEIYKRD